MSGFTDNLSNLPPGVTDRDIEEQQESNCFYCGKPCKDDICPKCEAKYDEGD